MPQMITREHRPALHARVSTMKDHGEPDLTIAQVAALTNQSVDTVADLVRMGRFFPNAYKAGAGARNSPWRIPATDVENYRKRQPHGPKPR